MGHLVGLVDKISTPESPLGVGLMVRLIGTSAYIYHGWHNAKAII